VCTACRGFLLTWASQRNSVCTRGDWSKFASRRRTCSPVTTYGKPSCLPLGGKCRLLWARRVEEAEEEEEERVAGRAEPVRRATVPVIVRWRSGRAREGGREHGIRGTRGLRARARGSVGGAGRGLAASRCYAPPYWVESGGWRVGGRAVSRRAGATRRLIGGGWRVGGRAVSRRAGAAARRLVRITKSNE